MDLIVPLGGFVFIVSLLGALHRMRQGDQWIGHGVLAGVGFAVMVWTLAVMSAS